MKFILILVIFNPAGDPTKYAPAVIVPTTYGSVQACYDAAKAVQENARDYEKHNGIFLASYTCVPDK